MPNGITPERMRVGCRAARNQLLKDVMRDYGYLEHMGMGIPRKIIKGMLEHNGTEPDLIAENEQFTLRLWGGEKAMKEMMRIITTFRRRIWVFQRLPF